MSRIVIGEKDAAVLSRCGDRTELVDASGIVIGFFEPAISRDPEVYARARAMFSDEEIARRCQEKGGKTTAEVWAHIAELEKANLERNPTDRS